MGMGMDLPMEDRKRVARGVPPRGCPEGRSLLHAECLIEGLDPTVEVTVRVRQTVERQVLDARGEPVDFLVVAGTRYAGREESVEHEVSIPSLPGRTARIEPAGKGRAELVESSVPVGTLNWEWEPLHVTIEAWVDEIAPGLRRVQVSVANRLEWDGGESRQPLRSFYSAEVVMHSPDGAFASLADPPGHLREQSGACHNEGLWPVLIGEAGDRRTMLASQIRLRDYPHAVPKAGPVPFGRGNDVGGRTIAGIRHAA
jgi:hypothetical protein